MANFNWITKSKNNGCKADVTISVTKDKRNNKKFVSFIIRNKKYNNLTQTGYVVVAVSSTRLYFGQSTEKDGYKITNKGGTTGCFGIKNDTLVEWAHDAAGNYELEFNPKYKLFYIDKDCPIDKNSLSDLNGQLSASAKERK